MAWLLPVPIQSCQAAATSGDPKDLIQATQAMLVEEWSNAFVLYLQGLNLRIIYLTDRNNTCSSGLVICLFHLF